MQPEQHPPLANENAIIPTTVEAWARAYIESTQLAFKLSPPEVPALWADPGLNALSCPSTPGRPVEFVVVTKVRRSRAGAASTEARLRLLHTFMHHELQAAELMAWALLRFPEAEPAFKRGLIAICLDEIRHLNGYANLLTRRGLALGCYPVRDWFWERIPTCTTPLQFVSLMGLGVEAANLEHSARFAAEFQSAGDDEAAALQHQVELDEISHVAFGRHWFERWEGRLDFDTWKAHLPSPLSPLLMRALPLNLSSRAQAGLNNEFLRDLAAWVP
jgi:uncharacterized ferritin-like protein (DUF455 family)